MSEAKDSEIENTLLSNGTKINSNDSTKAETGKKETKWTRIKDSLSLTKKGATPINWRVLSLVVVALFGSCYSITFLFPFVPDMILHFGYKEEEKGYYAGLVASSMFAGRIFGSYFWGWLSDVKGRRPVILLCLLIVGLTNVGFGFSVNLAMALAFRFLCGLFNGIVGTVKTMIYELSDNTNQGAGMSSIAVAWGSGIIIGPLLSGYLSEPAKRYPTIFSQDGLFGKFPFLLPSLVAALVPLIAMVLCWLFLPETLQLRIKKQLTLEVQEPQHTEAEKENETTLLSKATMSNEQISPNRPIINRQLSRVKGADVICSSAENGGNSPSAALSHPNINLIKSEGEIDGKYVSKGFAPSIASLEYIDSGRRKKRGLTQHDDPASHLYGYGCLVTSQGDLLLPDHYNSNGSFSSLFKRQRSTLSESSGGTGKDSSSNHDHKQISKSKPKLESSLSVPYDKEHHRIGDLRSGVQGGGGSLPDIKVEIANSASHSEVSYLRGNTEPKGEVRMMRTQSSVNSSKQNLSSRCCACWQAFKEINLIKLMSGKEVFYSVAIYTMTSFATIGFDDVFTIWASTDVMYSGLGFTPEKIGNALGLSSIPLILIQVFLFPFLEARLGAKKLFIYFCLILIASCMLIPSLRVIQHHTTLFWTLLLILMGLMKVATTSCFPANGLHINNSVSPEYAGSVNGIAMTLTAIGRTIAPIAGGSAFAWSIVHGVKIGFPFDVNLVFVMFSITFLLSNILCALMPDSLDKQSKKKQNKESEEKEE